MDPITRLLMQGSAGAREKVYVEDVFSTFLYSGSGSSRTITNGIDLAGEGGLVWTKARTANANTWQHDLEDTLRGAGNYLQSNAQAASQFNAQAITSFSSSGYSIGTISWLNNSSETYASWTFRRAAKFFDVVTYTGNNVNGRQIAHNLGSVPGCIIIKKTGDVDNWIVYHRSLGNTKKIYLNSTGAESSFGVWNSTSPTSTHFTVSNDGEVNAGTTYVAYLFAHDAGGFGDSGNDSVVSCGSYTYTSGNLDVNLGWEPQWILIKRSDSTGNWVLWDTMRGWPVGGAIGAVLYPNLSNAEFAVGSDYEITPTGFRVFSGTGTYIYIAIRRGPMKKPTVATTVFSLSTGTGTSFAGNSGDDLAVWKRTDSSAYPNLQWGFSDRVRGISLWTSWTTTSTSTSPVFYSHSTTAEVTNASRAGQYPGTTGLGGGNSNAITIVFNDGTNTSSGVVYFFRRAPGFFDVVAAAGTSTNKSDWPHALGVAPEMIIRKARTNSYNWQVWHTSISGNGVLNSNGIWSTGSGLWKYDGVNTNMTATTFSTSSSAEINGSSENFITYLFASCPGVSKVGSYTGTGTTQQINCGFTAGARFVLIRRTDSTYDWYVWDSARGIVSGNDPYLLLNSTNAEVTFTDWIDPLNTGFEISSSASAAINGSGGNFIFLAIA